MLSFSLLVIIHDVCVTCVCAHEQLWARPPGAVWCTTSARSLCRWQLPGLTPRCPRITTTPSMCSALPAPPNHVYSPSTITMSPHLTDVRICITYHVRMRELHLCLPYTNPVLTRIHHLFYQKIISICFFMDFISMCDSRKRYVYNRIKILYLVYK